MSVIEENLASLTSRSACREGRTLFDTDAVLDLAINGHTVNAKVVNERAGFERVKIRIRRNRISSRCTCRRKVSICSHAVAAVFQVTETVPEMLPFLREPNYDPAKKVKGRSSRFHSSVFPPARVTPAGADPLSPMVRNFGEDTYIQLRIPGSMPGMESRWSELELSLALICSDQEYSPGNIKKLVETGQASGNMRLSGFSPRDQQIMRLLVGSGKELGSTLKLGAHEVAALLHCLPAPRTMRTGEGALRVHSERVRPGLSIIKKKQGVTTLIPGIVVPARGPLPHDRITYIVGRNGYWIGLGLDYWWLSGFLPPSWFHMFRKGTPVKLDDAQAGRLQALCERGDVPASLILEDEADPVSVRAVHCQPVLSLDWTFSGILARMSFRYGDRYAVGDERSIMWDGKQLIGRDRDAEHSALSRLEKIGFSRTDEAGTALRLADSGQIWEFLDRALRELTDDWDVFWSPEFEARKNASGDLDLEVTPREESESWFETECMLTDRSGNRVPWEKIRQAINDNLEVVGLPDGSVVHIPANLSVVIRMFLRKSRDQHADVFRFDRCSVFALDEAVSPYWHGSHPDWRRLRSRLEAPVPSDLSLPGGLLEQLRDYQKEGVAWIDLLGECGFHGILADEMGLGKTVQALAAIAESKMSREKHLPSIVICPTSLLDNWVMEAGRFTPGLRSLVVRGSDRKELIEKISEFDLIVTSYALLRRDVDKYDEFRFDYAILDEAQHIKNPRTANARTCKALNAAHRLILTGTPVQNSLSEVWSLFDFLMPGLLGTHAEFRGEYQREKGGGAVSSNAVRLAKQIRPFILRRTKREVCRELPEKIEQVVYCELSSAQRELYNTVLMAGRELLGDGGPKEWNRNRFQILSLLLRLRQICCHPELLPDELRETCRDPVPSAKTELAKEIILEAIDSEHRILFFSQFTGVLGLIRPWLEENGILYEYLDGSTRNRQARVDRFNRDDSIPIFLLSLKAGGTGLTLTGADTVLHYDQWWNPMVEDQATDRAHRIGQEKNVTALKLVVRHTIEEKIVALQDSKREIFRELLAGMPGRMGDLTAEDVKFLLEDEEVV